MFPCVRVRVFSGGTLVKNLPSNARDTGAVGLISVVKIPWSRKWQHTLIFLPGKFHGQRSLVGYSPQDCKELDMTYTRL